MLNTSGGRVVVQVMNGKGYGRRVAVLQHTIAALAWRTTLDRDGRLPGRDYKILPAEFEVGVLNHYRLRRIYCSIIRSRLRVLFENCLAP
jgi:hypothetical protein